MKTLGARLVLAALVAGSVSRAFAGGPVEVFDYANRIPYTWTMSHWPNGQVPVYTDLGSLGVVNNGAAGDLVSTAVSEWSSVPTTTFRAAVAGDFTALGLGDVTLNNITSIIGTFNGGGIDIVYDNDGSIFTNYFGVDPTQVLGVTAIDFVGTGTPEILESWCVLSGPAVRSNDQFGVAFNGVVTHEFGHALNLAHTQANGAVQNPVLADSPQPSGCAAPYSGTAAATQVETMYPFSDVAPGGTGQYQAYVNHLDDIVAISNLYPAAGYPANKGTIQGQVLDPSGNPVTGVNVIARNVADPFNDVSSYISGQVSKAQAGPDGSFVLNGLTPGARYVVYVDALLNGAFSVPALFVLPGPEEYYNGAMESGSASTDDRCSWTTIAAAAGAPLTADITFNRMPGAPSFQMAPDLLVPQDLTPDGSIAVGVIGQQGGHVFSWNLSANTYDDLGGQAIGTVSISDDATKIVANNVDVDGVSKASIYQNGAWTPLPSVAGAVACNDSPSGPVITAGYDISGDGSTIVGMSYGTGGCYSGTIRGFKWTAAGGTVVLPKADPLNIAAAGRANAVNHDGSIIVGWDQSTQGSRRGQRWVNGTGSLIKVGTQPVGEALNVSSDGHYIVGVANAATSGNPWRYSQAGGVESLGNFAGYDGGYTNAISDDYGVITGVSSSSSLQTQAAAIWTSGLHWSSLYQIFDSQGIGTNGIALAGATAISSDNHTIVGAAATKYGYVGWVLKIPTVVMCHAGLSSSVAFPHGMDTALAQGDTLGPCACNAAAPTGLTILKVGKSAGSTAQVSWASVANASGYDVVRGSLGALRSSHGNFTTATTDCLESRLAATSRDDGELPAAGSGFWYLVRAASCGGHASYDEGAPSQAASRDAGIQASPNACP